MGLEPQSKGQFGHKGIQDQAPILDIGRMPLDQLGQKSHKKEGIWAQGRLLAAKGSEMGFTALGHPIRARGNMAWANCQSNFGPPLGHSPRHNRHWGYKDMGLRPLAIWQQEGGRRVSGFSVLPQDHGSDQHTIWPPPTANLGHKGTYYTLGGCEGPLSCSKGEPPEKGAMGP